MHPESATDSVLDYAAQFGRVRITQLLVGVISDVYVLKRAAQVAELEKTYKCRQAILQRVTELTGEDFSSAGAGGMR